MFNAISQVVYFHDPAYSKRIQERTDMEALAYGTKEFVHIVPPIMQLYPEIDLVYEEEHINPDTHGRYSWMLAGHRMYLLTPKGPPVYDPNIVVLLGYFLYHTKRCA